MGFVTLNNGIKMPQLGLEVMQMLDQGGGFALPEDADAFERVLNMWKQMFG